MVADLAHHDLCWMAPQPMWRAGPTESNGAAGQPAILRFATDAFMEELNAVTATHPERLPAWLARPETWRNPMPAPDTTGLAPQEPMSESRQKLIRIARGRNPVSGVPVPEASPDPLKLYQPAQGRFYLVTASLVCQLPGLPDRTVESGNQEQVRFVVRRLVPPSNDQIPDPSDPETTEYAFVPKGEGFAWQPIANVADRTKLQPNEERLPLFPLTYGPGQGNDTGRKRRLLAGAIPVGRRETYVGAPEARTGTDSGDTPEPADDPRAIQFRAEVITPWLAMIDQAAVTRSAILEERSGADEVAEARKMLLQFDERSQTTSWYVLLDLARFLQAHLPRVWLALHGGSPSPALSVAEQAAVDALESVVMHDDLSDALTESFGGFTVEPSLVAALDLVILPEVADGLERAEVNLSLPDGGDDWPDFLFMFAHPSVNVPSSGSGPITGAPNMAGARPALPGLPEDAVAALGDVIAAALPETPTAPMPELAPPPPMVSVADAWFAIRCVYERPNCVGFERPVLSRPSVPFQMASFFDPDAPARAIRIPMPLDVSPAALRKYKKGAGFVLSDMLCGRMQSFKRITLGDLIRSVLPWPLHKDLSPSDTPCGAGAGAAFGLFVSLSIPIVTICAFILMIIIVSLLDFIFRWMPYLMVAFPIFGLEAKKKKT